MAKKALLAILFLSLLVETSLAVAGFVAPEWLMGQFQVGVTADTRFLGYILAWMILLVTCIVGLTVYHVMKGNRVGWSLSYILGFWWLGIGIGIFAVFQRPDNLALDSAKGLLILLFARLSSSDAA